MGIAANIRNFWDELFYSALVDRLEEDLLRLRSDCESRLHDKDQMIAELRADKAALSTKVTMYELNINKRVGIDPRAKEPTKPSFANFNMPPMKSSWEIVQEKHDKELAKEAAEAQAKAQGE